MRSIQKLIDDYKKSDTKEQGAANLDDRPQYGCVHLCFTSKVPNDMLTQIAQCKPLAKRIRSFFVINLDFYFFNDNVYDFGKKNLMPMFKIIAEDVDSRRN